jgi:hypothetical protein
MTAAERCQQEQRLAELFTRQREANELNEHERADALFTQIWAVLAPEPEASHPCRTSANVTITAL